MAITKSNGTTVKIKGSAANQDITIGKLTSIGAIGPETEEIDVTTLDSAGAYRSFIPGYKDGGSVTFEGYLDSEDSGQNELITLFESGIVKDYVVTFPSGAKAEFSGFVKSYKLGETEVDGVPAFSAEIRVSGAVTFTAAA